MSDLELADLLEKMGKRATSAPWSCVSVYQHKAFNKQGEDANWFSCGIPEGDTELVCFLRNNLDRIVANLRSHGD